MCQKVVFLGIHLSAADGVDESWSRIVVLFEALELHLDRFETVSEPDVFRERGQ